MLVFRLNIIVPATVRRNERNVTGILLVYNDLNVSRENNNNIERISIKPCRPLCHIKKHECLRRLLVEGGGDDKLHEN